MDIYVGFDSAWTDNPKAPGAICAVSIKNGYPVQFHAPRLVSFDQALAFIRNVRRAPDDSGTTLIALDQPTIVPNLTSMRPVERAVASLVSWLGGGVQPSNRQRKGMFCDDSPIWRFLNALQAREHPEEARLATNGLYLIEVFPALALASFGDGYFGRLSAPKYNPARTKNFHLDDWNRVVATAAQQAHLLGCKELAEWCHACGKIARPRKQDQDKLDAALCALIALHWRLRPREESVLLGDLDTGYMVLPASPEVRDYLTEPARKRSVPIDGTFSRT
ncbi:DUF429 domain-containing protein [Komagataeibacter sp. AV436]|uniref:DUF429 domain-containing protein n=1 Tax=Komagataeibacter melomenusus TaxID=2766578 RepID=A0ABX2AE22_9PROT|nr:DUF429 domain-containing protein [Komagataeibacter melomenusus]MBV1829936.1 DUF429 domain-containing protein [Komagataeibacter melomenusus]NPC66005.1 DUF429 domain-containing protein [Komagataeibacter melomenusus]